MMRFHAFRPSVIQLESRWLPTSTIYPYPALNQEQDAYVAQAEQATNPVVFLGDSITNYWGTATREAFGSTLFTKDFAPLGAANFGIGGDTTDDLIARIQGGDLVGKPKVAVVMIGINNLWHEGETPAQAAAGVAGVVEAIQAASPQTKILLLGVLPTTDPVMNPEVQALNSMISALGNLPGVVFENPGLQFLGPDGEGQPDLYVDGVHPDQAGYTVLANAIDGTVVNLLQQADAAADPPVAVSPSKPAAKATADTTAKTVVTTQPDAVPEVEIPDPPTLIAPTDLIATTTKPKTTASELINVPTG